FDCARGTMTATETRASTAGTRRTVRRMAEDPSGEFPENEALQVIGFRNAEQDGMIAALHPLLDDGDLRVAVDGGFVEDLSERRLVHVVGAAAGHKVPSRVQQTEGPQVDLL